MNSQPMASARHAAGLLWCMSAYVERIFKYFLKKIKNSVLRSLFSRLVLSENYALPNPWHAIGCVLIYYVFTYKAKLYPIAAIGDWYCLRHGYTSNLYAVFQYFSQERTRMQSPTPYFLTEVYYREYINNTHKISALCHYLLVGSILGHVHSVLCKQQMAEFIDIIPYDVVKMLLSPINSNPISEKIYDEVSSYVENVWTHNHDYIVNVRLDCIRCQDWCVAQNKTLVECGPGESTILPAPEFALGCDAATAFKSEIQGLPLYIAHPGKVLAISGTTLMFMEDGSHCCDLLAYTLQTHDTVMLSPLSSWGQQPKTVHVQPVPNVLSRGVLGFCNVDANYYHWMVEGLTRIFAARQTGRYDAYPVLVTQRPYASLKRSLEILWPQAELIEIPPLASIIVEDAVYPSDINIVYETPHIPCTPEKIQANIPLLREMRSQFLCKHTRSGSVPHWEKLYIGRASAFKRQVTNSDEFMPHIHAHGFRTLYPEQYSLDEQIEIFRYARQIILPTGAAATNILFCENAQICVLMPEKTGGFTGVWQSLALPGNNMIMFIFGKSKDMYSEYSIDIDDIHECLARFSGIHV